MARVLFSSHGVASFLIRPMELLLFGFILQCRRPMELLLFGFILQCRGSQGTKPASASVNCVLSFVFLAVVESGRCDSTRSG